MQSSELYWSLPVRVSASVIDRNPGRFARFVRITRSGRALVAVWERRTDTPYALLCAPSQLLHSFKSVRYPAMPAWAMQDRPVDAPWLDGGPEPTFDEVRA